MKLDARLVLGDILRGACDDVRLRLPVGLERRLSGRVVELLEASGVELHRLEVEPDPVKPIDDPSGWW